MISDFVSTVIKLWIFSTRCWVYVRWVLHDWFYQTVFFFLKFKQTVQNCVTLHAGRKKEKSTVKTFLTMIYLLKLNKCHFVKISHPTGVIWFPSVAGCNLVYEKWTFAGEIRSFCSLMVIWRFEWCLVRDGGRRFFLFDHIDLWCQIVVIKASAVIWQLLKYPCGK